MEWASFAGGWIAGYLFTWPGLLGLFLLGVVFEHNDWRGFAVFTGLVALVSAYFFFDIPLVTLAMITAAYAVIGFIWSFWRYKRFVVTKLVEYKSRYSSNDGYYAREAAGLAPGKHIDTISAWVIIWPFSMVGCITGDIIDAVGELIQKFFKGVYRKIYDSAMKAAGL